MRRLSVTSNDVIDTIEKVIENKEKEEYISEDNKSTPEKGRFQLNYFIFEVFLQICSEIKSILRL